jgi:hypothetical protein
MEKQSYFENRIFIYKYLYRYIYAYDCRQTILYSLRYLVGFPKNLSSAILNPKECIQQRTMTYPQRQREIA